MVLSKPLVIVESPAKVKTLKKYLGTGYNVAATLGHIKDLPEKEIGVNIQDGFKPEYKNIPGKRKIITALKKAAGNATDIYLAPDPDREGEAIAWHTADVLKKKGRKFHRVLFNELTKKAILDAMASSSELNQNKYEAQQVRRILDRLVGYQISPLLWRKVKSGLSAGRVQSVALRIICDRERAIQAFIPEEYWSITALLKTDESQPFNAKIAKENGKKISIPNEKKSSEIVKKLTQCDFFVEKVRHKTTRRNPLPPFITSKLQQEAITKLRFSAKKTMDIAQQLYEGIDLGPGDPVGLITYMRTDSTRIASEAAQEALTLIREKFGDQYALESPRAFKNRKKAQDAHEAIRPTSVFNTPDQIKPCLSKDQLALYTLIWKRFVASQMKQALINMTSVAIKAGPYTFSLSGSSIKFPGFMILYKSVEEEMDKKKEKQQLPELTEGIQLTRIKIEPKQHFTMPPPRFSEGSLVKELEENGIGRPSTYTAILSTIRAKKYVDLVKGYFKPNEMGFIINDLLVKSFPEILDVDFTSKMEDNLDRLEADQIKCIDILSSFYNPFVKKLEEASKNMQNMRGIGFPTDLNCPKCSKNLSIKVSKYGPYLACNGYPECTYTAEYTRDEKGNLSPVEAPANEEIDITCEKCGKPMLIKHGRNGQFIACSGYPKCKNTKSIITDASNQKIDVNCPEENCTGKIVQRRSRRGKIFYSCDRYPDCTFAIWDKPVPQKCPNCDAAFLVEKSTKKEGVFLSCNNKECGYKKYEKS